MKIKPSLTSELYKGKFTHFRSGNWLNMLESQEIFSFFFSINPSLDDLLVGMKHGISSA